MVILLASKRRLRCSHGKTIAAALSTERLTTWPFGSLHRQRSVIPTRSSGSLDGIVGTLETQRSPFGWTFNRSLVLTKTIGSRMYHTDLDLEQEERIRLTTLRLYRILQRTCTEFDTKALDNDSILLHPILEAPDWGRHAMYTPPTPTQLEELYRLFYVWNDTTDDRGLGVFSADDGGGNDPSTPTTRTTTTMAESDSPFTPNFLSSIDRWYYDLVTKSTDDETHREGGGDESSGSTLPPMTSMTCWTSQTQLREAIRTAFRKLHYQDGIREQGTATRISSTALHKWAIKAMHILQEQQVLWRHSSVATTDGIVRIIATSRCIGTTAPAATTMPPSVTTQMLADSTPKYRFAYRIRVENISDDQTIQLLGRYWYISEEPVMKLGMEAFDDDDDDDGTPPPIIVDSPKTGAVGQLPVLQPGQVFEYMSGTDLVSPKGTMTGHLYMARVPSTAQSAKSGDNVNSLLKEAEQKLENIDEISETRFFEASVAPFPLEAE